MTTEKEIIVDNLKINYREQGEGKTILILPGWGRGSESWLKVMDNLSANGFRIICLDLPGFGKSDIPLNVWGVKDYAFFVKKFIDALNIKDFFIVSHSFGGGLAVKLLADFAQKTEKLILIAPAIIRIRERIKPRQKIKSFLTGLIKKIFPEKLIQKIINFPFLAKVFYRILGSYDYYISIIKSPIMKETFKKIIKEDLVGCLTGVKVPTLIIWGKKDTALPVDDAYRIKEKIDGAEIALMENADHTPYHNYPEELARLIIDFLKK